MTIWTVTITILIYINIYLTYCAIADVGCTPSKCLVALNFLLLTSSPSYRTQYSMSQMTYSGLGATLQPNTVPLWAKTGVSINSARLPVTHLKYTITCFYSNYMLYYKNKSINVRPYSNTQSYYLTHVQNYFVKIYKFIFFTCFMLATSHQKK